MKHFFSAAAFFSALPAATTALPSLVAWHLFAAAAAMGQTAQQKEFDTVYQQAESLWQKGKYREALPHYQRAAELAPKAFGAQSANAAIVVNNLADLYKLLGQDNEAEQLLQRVLKSFPGDVPQRALTLNNLGEVSRLRGRYTEARERMLEALRIKERQPKRDEASIAATLNNLGLVAREMGDYTVAEKYAKRALALQRANLKQNDYRIGIALDNLANVYMVAGRTDEAIALVEEAMAIFRAVMPDDHPDLAICHNNLGFLLSRRAKFDEAEPLFKQSLSAAERQGDDHPMVASALDNLATLYQRQGKFAQAEPLFRRALAINERRLAAGHGLRTQAMNNLAYLLFCEGGRDDEVESLLKQALGEHELAEADEGGRKMVVLVNFARLAATRGDWPAGLAATDRARRLVRTHADSLLPSLSEPEQLAYLALDLFQRHEALSLGLVRRDDREACERSAEWLLNSKGIGLRALAQQTLLTSNAGGALRSTAEELIAVRRKMAALALAPGGQSQARAAIQKQLAAREQDLAKKLGMAVATGSSSSSWTQLDSLRRLIPADGVLIEFARFDVRDFAADDRSRPWRPPRYAAWVIPPLGQGQIQIADLGPAEEIERRVAAVRDQFNSAPGRIRSKGEADAEQLAREALSRLSEKIVEPLGEPIGGAKRWFVSPDAALWLVPWPALMDGDAYVIERHSVELLVTGRDLASPAGTRPATTKSGLVLADPDFDAGPGKQAVSGTTRSVALSEQRHWARLPGTAQEASIVRPSLAKYLGRPPDIVLGRDATEARFLAARQPRVVLLSTHGFFLADEELPPDDVVGVASASGVKVRGVNNPLLRCALVLAGANRPPATDSADGLLSGLEIVGADLRGTELVVLSACETGVGALRQGEGVAGLRQAFQIAGAKAVVSTLWKIPDQETIGVMSDFFKHLAAGKNKAEALREAQLAQIKARRREYGAAHPYYWSAFTVTGTN